MLMNVVVRQRIMGSLLAGILACGRPAEVLPAGPLDRIAARIEASGAVVGLYYRDLDTGDSLAYAADRRCHAASTMNRLDHGAVPRCRHRYDARRPALRARDPDARTGEGGGRASAGGGAGEDCVGDPGAIGVGRRERGELRSADASSPAAARASPSVTMPPLSAPRRGPPPQTGRNSSASSSVNASAAPLGRHVSRAVSITGSSAPGVHTSTRRSSPSTTQYTGTPAS